VYSGKIGNTGWIIESTRGRHSSNYGKWKWPFELPEPWNEPNKVLVKLIDESDAMFLEGRGSDSENAAR
jgi:hypothetical protein